MRALLAAGGTGGHLFPAEAVASVLTRRGHEVVLVTDERATSLVDDFPAIATHFLPAATPSVRNPVKFVGAAVVNAMAFWRCLRIVRRTRPDVALGFGGYPTVPPLTATKRLDVPTVVHEANAVIGRANRFLAPGAHVATSFPDLAGLPDGVIATAHVGIPVREAVLQAAAPYAAPDDTFRLLVFGGSQGARAFADLVPPAIATLDAAKRARLSIVQQCRPEDMDRVREAYGPLVEGAELAPFFRDLPARMAAAHLVVSRAGASTVAELSIIGRPSLLVPLPGALDQDQAANASALEALGGARELDQAELTPESLGREIAGLMDDPARLAGMAQQATGLAKPDAAERLADLAERLAAAKTAQGDAA